MAYGTFLMVDRITILKGPPPPLFYLSNFYAPFTRSILRFINPQLSLDELIIDFFFFPLSLANFPSPAPSFYVLIFTVVQSIIG